MAPFAHPCAGRADNVTIARPEAVGLGKALADEMADVARRFEGKGEWSQKVHIRVKGSGAALASSFQKENKFLRAYRAKAKGGRSNSKGQRMSDTVRRMLMKGKAGGRSGLHQDDRFYLEIRFGGLLIGEDGTSSSPSSSPSSPSSSSSCPPLEVVDYIFVSRLWTLGRTLDEAVGKHQAALRKVYPPSPSSPSHKPSPTSYTFLNERTGLSLHPFLGRSLLDLASAKLVDDYESLILLPFSEEGGKEEGENEGAKEGEAAAREGGEEGEKEGTTMTKTAAEAVAVATQKSKTITAAVAAAVEPMSTEVEDGQSEGKGEASLPPSLTLYITQDNMKAFKASPLLVLVLALLAATTHAFMVPRAPLPLSNTPTTAAKHRTREAPRMVIY
ncbi:an1-type zinc finger partial [Nannochloropsis oceanica]